MYVQDVLRFDQSGKEAELIVSDGAYEVLRYAYPIDAVKTGMTVSGLSGFSCTNMVRAAEQRCAVSKLPSYFAYNLTGKLISKQEGIVQVNNLKISLDAHIPNDLSNGEYISFDVLRLDLD